MIIKFNIKNKYLKILNKLYKRNLFLNIILFFYPIKLMQTK